MTRDHTPETIKYGGTEIADSSHCLSPLLVFKEARTKSFSFLVVKKKKKHGLQAVHRHVPF